MSPEFRAPSNGPTTEEGKRASSQNAVRHGLFDHYLQSFDPQGPVEMDTVGELASTYWRMRRLWTIETTLMNEQLARMTPITRIAGSFSTRLHRIYQRALKNLLAIREIQKLPNEAL